MSKENSINYLKEKYVFKITKDFPLTSTADSHNSVYLARNNLMWFNPAETDLISKIDCSPSGSSRFFLKHVLRLYQKKLTICLSNMHLFESKR